MKAIILAYFNFDSWIMEETTAAIPLESNSINNITRASTIEPVMSEMPLTTTEETKEQS